MIRRMVFGILVMTSFAGSLVRGDSRSPGFVRPVVVWTAKFLFDKLFVDEIWDRATGKPDLKLLDHRLKELEAHAVMRGELHDEIHKLREGLSERVTRDEFRKMVEKTRTQIDAIQKRLDDLEERVERLEAENGDLKNGTKNASDANYFAKRAEGYERTKDYYKAIACANLAIRLAPSDANHYVQRCSCYVALGAPGVVIPDAAEALRLDPKNAAALRFRGIGRAYEKDYDGAIKDINDAQQIDSTTFKIESCRKALAIAYTGRAIAFRSDNWAVIPTEQDYTFSMAQLNAALNFDSKYAEAFYRRGMIFDQRKEYDKALDAFNMAIELDPSHALAYLNRGWCRVFLKVEYVKAIDDLTKAIALDPKDCGDWFLRDAYVGRNIANYHNGNKAASEADRAAAIRIAAELRKKGK